MKHYEHRPEQLAMAEAVERAIRGSHHLVVEAGTGVGKSFAYLVPAILAAAGPRRTGKRQGRRLDPHDQPQEQLITKDIPLLNSLLPLEVHRRAGQRPRQLSEPPPAAQRRPGIGLFARRRIRAAPRITDWARDTGDGSLAGLPFRPIPGVWDEVASDSGNCMGRNCPHNKDCFYFKARRRMLNAQILIVNHALLCSDLNLRRQGVSILPEYNVLIVDEAHNLEAVAGDHLGIGVTSGQVDYVLNRLYNDRTNKGLLVGKSTAEAQRLVADCRDRASEFFESIDAWLHNRAGGNGRVRAPGVVANPLSEGLSNLARSVRKVADGIKEPDQRQDFVAAGERLNGLAAGGRGLAAPADAGGGLLDRAVVLPPAFACEIGGGADRRGARASRGPFRRAPTVVLTSATLATGTGSFDFFKSRIGLTKAETLCLGSPFDYREQAELVLVDAMPDPASESRDYERKVVEMIRRYVARTDGRAFVLFTSYEMMRRITEALVPWLAENDLALFSQSEGMPRSQMLERFKQNPRSVLFGTDSFWQGVDVPGDALRNVIITRLPSACPTTPSRRADRSDSSPRGEPVPRFSGPLGDHQAQAGLRAADPDAERPGDGRDPGPPGAIEALWPDVLEIAAGLPGGCGAGRLTVPLDGSGQLGAGTLGLKSACLLAAVPSCGLSANAFS